MPTSSPTARPDERGSVVLDRMTKRYGDQAAVDDLSLTIQPGEFISLLGPSGCGKTTTLRMIAGFEHPDAGDIRISGSSVLGLPPYRRNVNTVFQAYALFPHMTVAENVAYGLQQKRAPRSRRSASVSSQALGPRADAPLRRSQADPALGRSAAARRARARAGEPPRRAAAGRAAGRARPPAARGDAARAQAPPVASGHHVRVRHA